MSDGSPGEQHARPERFAAGAKIDTFMAGDGWVSRLFYNVGWLLVCPLFRLYTRMTINGREHIPKTGPFVLAPVHRSYVDTPIAGCVTRRRLRFMGKQEMWKNRQLGWIFSALGSFPVDRGAADLAGDVVFMDQQEAAQPLRDPVGDQPVGGVAEGVAQHEEVAPRDIGVVGE